MGLSQSTMALVTPVCSSMEEKEEEEEEEKEEEEKEEEEVERLVEE